ISLFVQMTAAGLLIGNLLIVRRVALRVSEGDETVALAAAALTAFYLPLNNWSLQGMEVSALVALTSLAIWLAMRSVGEPGVAPRLAAVLALATLVRPDMIVLCASIAVFLLWSNSIHGRRAAAMIAVAAVLSLGLQSAARWWYFGDLVPN